MQDALTNIHSPIESLAVLPPLSASRCGALNGTPFCAEHGDASELECVCISCADTNDSDANDEPDVSRILAEPSNSLILCRQAVEAHQSTTLCDHGSNEVDGIHPLD